MRKFVRFATAAFCLAACLAGCGPDREMTGMMKAMSARVDHQPDYNASCRFLDKYLARHDKDYVMWSMDYCSLCLMGGNYDQAKAELLRCFMDIEKRQDTDKEKAAAVSNESLKIFKGEPFERAMLCTYLGILHYVEGDYNNARIFCARADMEDATTEDDMKDYRHDFGLAHYWLGRSYLKLGQEDNARVAFGKAGQHIARKNEDAELKGIRKAQENARTKRMRLEAQSYKNATQSKEPVPGAADMSASPRLAEMPADLAALRPPVPADAPVREGAGASAGDDPVELAAVGAEDFLRMDFQKDVNLILVIETGIGPVKFLAGEEGCMDAIVRGPYDERGVLVYLNGHRAGPAFRMLDMFHQADTRGTSEKDRAQIAKGVSKAILKQLPYVSYVAGYWDVRADDRYWRLMPGEVHVFAAKVRPGLYTVNLQCFDSNGYLLPRHSLTRYCLPVHEGAENIYFLHTKPEADNAYFPPEKKSSW